MDLKGAAQQAYKQQEETRITQKAHLCIDDVGWLHFTSLVAVHSSIDSFCRHPVITREDANNGSTDNPESIAHVDSNQNIIFLGSKDFLSTTI